MTSKHLRWACLAFLATALGCTRAAQPLQPSGTPTQSNAPISAASSASLAGPQLLTPAANQTFKFGEQPLTLTVKNGFTTGPSGLTYGFQIASDAGFGSIVYSKTGVAPGSGGRTSVTADKLPGSKVYFWRSQVTSGSTALFSHTRSFAVGPEVVLGTPTLASPTANGVASGQAVLVVNNVTRSGPAGQITYRFDVADSSSFGNLVFSSTVDEQSGQQTSVTVTGALSSGATYFWRVQAFDASNAVVTAFSNPYSFQFIAFDMSQAVILNNPPDLPTWPVTAHITFIQFRTDALLVDFDKRTGPDRWPNAPFTPGDRFTGDGVQYTLGMCLKVGGQWYCSAPIQFWQDRPLEAAAPPYTISRTWFYDPGRWGPMAGYQPADGETVGIFVAVGNIRNMKDSALMLFKERSNVVLVPFDNGSGTTYTYAAGKQRLTVPKHK
jgi:hypothetical protein